MYQIKFVATDDADWTEGIEIIDDDTNLAAVLDDGTEVELDVTDDGTSVLSAATADATMGLADNVISWTFTKAQMAALDVQRTYSVGCRLISPDDARTLLFTGSLALIDGGMA